MFGVGFVSLEGIMKKLSNESIEFVIALRPVAFFQYVTNMKLSLLSKGKLF